MFARRIALVTIVLGISVASLPIGALAASAFPSKPVTVVVPFPAGGRSDITIRLLGAYLEKILKQPFVVLNKPGAGGTIGFKGLAQSQPDGYTIGFTTNAVVMTQYTVPENIDLRDFEPICLFNSDPAVLAVAYSAPWKDLPGFVRFGKDNPRKLLIGINPGASAHIFAAAFGKVARIETVFVPYKGGPERVSALAGGHINADFGVLAQYRSMVDATKVRILGVAAASRLPGNKDIPTFLENGLDLQISGWQGLFAPRGTPPDVLSLIDDSVKKALGNQEFIDRLEKIDVQETYLSRRDFAAFLAKENSETRQLLGELGLMVTAPK